MKNLSTRNSCSCTLAATFLTVITLAFSNSTLADSAPYNYTKYQSVLDDSKLQAPDSSTYIKQGDFSGAYNQYFYIPSSGNKWMTFDIGPSEKMRSELRQIENWSTGDSTTNKMIGSVLISEFGTADEITIMQIHDDPSEYSGTDVNKPLVRIAWLESQKETGGVLNTTNAIFAIVKTGTCSLNCSDYVKYALVDLDSYGTDDPIKFEIRVTSNKLSIKVNNITNSNFNNFDVSHWENMPSYFKAGAYIQSNTSPDVKVQFETLKYYN